MYGKILASTVLGFGLGLGLGYVEDVLKDLAEARYARSYERWVYISERLCLSPPPTDPVAFEKWRLDSDARTGEMVGDIKRRLVYGEPSCVEERRGQ